MLLTIHLGISFTGKIILTLIFLLLIPELSKCQNDNSTAYFSNIKKISIEKGHSQQLLLTGHIYKNKKIKNISGAQIQNPVTDKRTSNIWSSHYIYTVNQEITGRSKFGKSNSSKTILVNTPGCMEDQVSSVFSIKKKDLPYIAAVTGITLGLFTLDAKIDKNVTNLDDNSSVVNATSEFITEFGASKGIYTVAGFAGLSIIFRSSKGLQTSLYAFEAMLTSGLWIRLGKLLAGRERPSASYEYSRHPGGIWRGPVHQIINEEKRSVASYDAFPSGHTATIFSIATVFAEQYKDIPVVPVFCYSFATLVGISRMIEHTHWASDVFLGGVIGYLCGQAVINFYKPHDFKINNKTVSFSVKPVLAPQNYGADVGLNF